MTTVKRFVLTVLVAAVVFALSTTAQAQQPGEPISATETLRGHAAMSVDVVSSWQGDTRSELADGEFRSILEQALSDAGIQVLPAGSYPMLRLQMGNYCCWSHTGSLALYDDWFINLFFVQLVPVPGGASATMEAMSWRRTEWNFTAGWMQTQDQMRNGTRSLAGFFLEQHRTVNR